ncbi:MAG: hypothetical protein Q7S28_00355, partial [bacterium]|nr:hypothetical protein [bacterium]
VLVARDARLSSPALYSAVLSGLARVPGIKPIEAGMATTPMAYFLVCSLGADGGIMVTASHNPKEYNGLKIMGPMAFPISGTDVLKMVGRAARRQTTNDKRQTTISTLQDTNKQFVKRYAAYLKRSFRIKKPITIVCDSSNGAAGVILAALKVPCVRIISINSKADGNFPAHGPNPMLTGAMDELRRTVKKYKADFGAAFDADADRVFFVDERGREILADAITRLLAPRFKGAVAIDVRSGYLIRRSGLPFIEGRVGHYFAKKLMLKNKLEFGGELSGHFYFRPRFGKKFAAYDSALLTLAAVASQASALKAKRSSLGQWCDELPRYYQSGEINFRVKGAKRIMARMERIFGKNAERVSHLDGVRMDFKDHWINIRTSNTEPLLRINIEATTKRVLEKELQVAKKLIQG